MHQLSLLINPNTLKASYIGEVILECFWPPSLLEKPANSRRHLSLQLFSEQVKRDRSKGVCVKRENQKNKWVGQHFI